MPRVSEEFKLGRHQATLDFVDVDTVGDTPLFLDPRAIERLDSGWGRWSHELLREFFERVLAAVRDGRKQDGLTLLSGLGEPNQTHLGMSKGRARGSGLGEKLADQLWERLQRSQAQKSGLLQHLEDTALLVEGINVDRISDIATNLIREPLIVYTQGQCDLLDIPREQVGAGSVWDSETGEWQPEEYELLPVTPTGSLLLVPKIIVRQKLDFDVGEYYTRHILRFLVTAELTGGGALVRTLKSGKPKVLVKDIRAKVKAGYNGREGKKRAAIDYSVENPQLLQNYRNDKERMSFQRPPLDLGDFSTNAQGAPPNWNRLLKDVTDVAPGAAGATRYHRRIEALLTALFYPALVDPRHERTIDQGRKRVDIYYTNSGVGRGFFRWLSDNFPPQPYVYVECKNYSNDLGNAELDQLAGRFNLGQGGRFGLLVNRGFDDKARFIQRCRDAALKDRGYIIALDDDDLKILTHARRDDNTSGVFRFLTRRFGDLVE